MNIRKARQEEILDLIKSEPISTQDDLIRGLQKRGFEVTQATISRDIKELKLVKRPSSTGKSIYAAVETKSDNLTSKYNAIFAESVISADYAMNTCVIKTHVGMANAACAALDALAHEEIVGTLAGDDTIFALCKTEENAKMLASRILILIGE